MGISIITDKVTLSKTRPTAKIKVKIDATIPLLKEVLIDLTNEAGHKEIIVQKVEYELILECCSHRKEQGHSDLKMWRSSVIQVGNKDLNAIALEAEIVEEEKGWATAGSNSMESSQKKDVIMDFVEEKPKSRFSLDSSRISKNQADKPIPRKIQRPKKKDRPSL
ncbi:hypothetical protein RDI58_024268 [Solanum bulbocastanum]|uniref:Uncharacterized protein n=1 Tax=Solanum bulbocastanum TaxID=147425 RepID=A0AAN8Y3F8_SOLBU